MRILGNGINPSTRELLYPPISQEIFGMNVFDSALQNQHEITNLLKSTQSVPVSNLVLPFYYAEN